jgi:hypothetical protein
VSGQPATTTPAERVVGPFEQWRAALAENFEMTASWRREQMAGKFPDDERHLRCAEALDGAAIYTSYIGPSMTLAPFFGLLGTPLWREPPWELLAERLPSPSKFWFRSSSGEYPTTRDVDQLIADSFADLFKRSPQHVPASLGDDSALAYFGRRGSNLYLSMSGIPLPR